MNDVFLQNRFFADVPEDLLRSVQIAEKQYPAGAVIVEEGSAGSTLLLIGSGRVQISRLGRQGQPEVFSVLEAGDFFGELTVIDHGPRSATATALEPTLIGEIDRETLDGLMEKAPRVLPLTFTKVVVERLRSTNARYIEQLLRNERLALLGTMISSVIHDLKNPMSAVMSSVDYLERGSTDHRTRTLTAIARSAVNRMVQMTEELLDFARGKANLRLGQTSAARILSELEQDVLGQIRASKVRVTVDQQSRATVWMDQVRITRCLTNLLKNAFEVLRDHGEVYLRFWDESDSLEVTVRDNGPGIPPEVRDRIFEPFVTFRKQGGTGLGLAIAKSVVEAHGGRIWLEEGPGATFRISLPRRATQT
ncbi:MAG: cyclic nucleotide-binding domain-containing protein [Verrucomicrobia bacterium]|nr:cyclic nucleotide-binding domain-containing protein [Verrucomicrobiota bacterium]